MNTQHNQIVILDANEEIPSKTDRINNSGQPLVEVGQWYWVRNEKLTRDDDGNDRIEVTRWLGCVMTIGSNYIGLKHPKKESYGAYTARVHFDEFMSELEREHDPQAYINSQIERFQLLASQQLNEVKAITARLGITNQCEISERTQPVENSNALVVLSSQDNLHRYESDLVVAKDKLLPELFEAIKETNAELTRWMTANLLPLEAVNKSLSGSIGEIKERIFNVSLYAGLTETVIECNDGEPAAFHEKLHVLQRMHYMDEECLLNYRHGGMDFRKIEQFDAWICEPINRDRILPYPKCLIAMRVRRNVKQRDWDGSLESLFVNINLSHSDKFTYLYIRNGERISRLCCELDFGETIFPNRDMFDPSRPLMAKMSGPRVEKLMTVDEYNVRCQEFEVQKSKYEQWKIDNPRDEWNEKNPRLCWDYANPYRFQFDHFSPSGWNSFDDTNVYFDEIAEHFTNKLKEYNRIALVIQGLFDRSPVLHPHPPARIWTPAGFDAAIELVYDGSNVLHHGEAPDIEAYIAKCNASLKAGSITVGQELVWMEKEAEKESHRIDNDYRNRSEYRPKVFKPEGNPGPGYIAKIAKWKPRAKVATFEWMRMRRSANAWDELSTETGILATVTVPESRLFNVDAYKPGDYLQFFLDSRTRAQYLKWAPMLLAAEEYYAGNMELLNKKSTF